LLKDGAREEIRAEFTILVENRIEKLIDILTQEGGWGLALLNHKGIHIDISRVEEFLF
jgi:hypothetical protein